VQTNRDDVLCCDSCGAFFSADAPESLNAWYSVDFCSAECMRRCFRERGGQLYGGRGTVLLIFGRTPVEHLVGVTNDPSDDDPSR
jgi:hypothetical protein